MCIFNFYPLESRSRVSSLKYTSFIFFFKKELQGIKKTYERKMPNARKIAEKKMKRRFCLSFAQRSKRNQAETVSLVISIYSVPFCQSIFMNV